MRGAPVSRRAFVRVGTAGFVVPAAALLLPGRPGAAQRPPDEGAQRPRAGGGDAGALYDPTRVGRPQPVTDDLDSDTRIRDIELRLKCPCPCSLDVFTCRTTDFTCTYSPERHREVVAMWREGKTAEEIIEHFVALEGEKALMAPKPQGFNLAGYLVPGIAMVTAGAVLVAVLLRRRAQVAALTAPAPVTPTEAPVPVGVGVGEPEATPEELERLRQALRDLDG